MPTAGVARQRAFAGGVDDSMPRETAVAREPAKHMSHATCATWQASKFGDLAVGRDLPRRNAGDDLPDPLGRRRAVWFGCRHRRCSFLRRYRAEIVRQLRDGPRQRRCHAELPMPLGKLLVRGSLVSTFIARDSRPLVRIASGHVHQGHARTLCRVPSVNSFEFMPEVPLLGRAYDLRTRRYDAVCLDFS